MLNAVKIRQSTNQYKYLPHWGLKLERRMDIKIFRKCDCYLRGLIKIFFKSFFFSLNYNRNELNVFSEILYLKTFIRILPNQTVTGNIWHRDTYYVGFNSEIIFSYPGCLSKQDKRAQSKRRENRLLNDFFNVVRMKWNANTHFQDFVSFMITPQSLFHIHLRRLYIFYNL